jgi:hypothetical protein
MDELKFKNKKCMKYEKIAVVKILETNASKNKLLYIYDDRSCWNTLIDWCKSINDIELTTKGGGGVNKIDRILQSSDNNPLCMLQSM